MAVVPVCTPDIEGVTACDDGGWTLYGRVLQEESYINGRRIGSYYTDSGENMPQRRVCGFQRYKNEMENP